MPKHPDLPRSITPSAFNNKPLPGDMTLDEAKNFFMHDQAALNLAEVMKVGKILRIRFMLPTEPPTEAPDAMNLDQWRKAGGTIEIDDNGGGLKTAQHQPRELV